MIISIFADDIFRLESSASRFAQVGSLAPKSPPSVANSRVRTQLGGKHFPSRFLGSEVKFTQSRKWLCVSATDTET